MYFCDALHKGVSKSVILDKQRVEWVKLSDVIYVTEAGGNGEVPGSLPVRA